MSAQPAFLATRSAYADWSAPDNELDHGRGAWLYARDGRRFLDLASGSGSLIFGHGDEGAISALARQAARFTVYPTAEFRAPEIEAYLQALVAFAGGQFSRALLASSGSDAVEAACKLALQHHQARGDTGRTQIIGRAASYHGNSLFGLGAGGFVRRRAPYEAVLDGAPKASPAFCYRCDFDLAPDACAVQCAASLERVFRSFGSGRIAAFILEPVVGAALGSGVPDPRYLAAVRDICDRHGALLIADEVMTGFGRTGQPLAWRHWNVQPDIAVVGKAMSAGYFPLSGVLATERVAAPLRANASFFENGQTHLFSPSGAAVGAYVLDRLARDGLVERAHALGERLRARLSPLLGMRYVGDVRGLGLMLGIEFVRDKATRAPFLADAGIARRFARAAAARGAIVYPSSGGARTLDGDHVLLLPPLTLGEDEADFAATALIRAADDLADDIDDAPDRAPTGGRAR
jgi:adenosylmethionine-8-amino-7-oxononanoate aminotransferase